ncbi:LPS-assembly protein LptD [Chitinimonas koreensis]|uniref:LPS-assembly protein LptD n=1 Tax=Chitinimonas koreensis TaxID=356302 RepID=UPI0004043887|nr:LPS-assembly protein LptD [Chitinimonas koreensis]QNM96990.1 LPS-assembly protein LptD [Chitinimonas koreensis]
MPRFKPLSLAVCCALAALAGPAYAEEPAAATPPADAPAGPTVIHADQVEGIGQAETTARGNVSVEQDGRRIEAQWAKLFQDSGEIRAGDRTRMTQDKDVLEGGELYFKQESRTGELDAPNYRFGERAGRGDAVKLIFDGPDRYTLQQARFTTCAAGDDSWFIRARELDLDYSRNLGVAHHGTVEFKGVPLLYSPYLDFSLDGSRKSGLLAPSFDSSSSGGFELAIPYYWNIAPNYDATISPRIITKRGLMLGTEFRYLGERHNGVLSADVIGKDRVYGDERHALRFEHHQQLAPAWRTDLNVQAVSDDSYFADFGDRLAVASQQFLPREGTLNYNQGAFAAMFKVQRYQTLQDPARLVDEPYARLPQLTANYSRVLAGPLRLDVASEAVRFANAWSAQGGKRPEGDRYLAYPSVSLPIERGYGFVTPKLGFHSTRYRLDEGQRYGRDLPVFSLDSGLFFDRETHIAGRDMVQSLEPRAYYVRIPYRDQSKIPNFDSGKADFSFAQMFTENQYTGSDRLNDANQLTLALTSRLFEADNGVERARFAVGQRFYFEPQRVTLGEAARGDDVTASDVIVTAGGQPFDAWWLDAATQYDRDAHRTSKATFNLRYQPDPGRLLNFRYRLDRFTDTKQLDLSTQWAVTRNWQVLARHNWSIKDRRPLETLAGLEYNANCWAFRLLAQRYVTRGNDMQSRFFFQLELNDVGRLGTNALQTLRDSIPGYTKLN